MKILLIDANCKYSSTGIITYNLYSYLNSFGHTASICYGRGRVVKEKNIYKFGIDIETMMHAFLTRITGFTGCYSFFSTLRLIRYIKRFKPNIVHIHEIQAYFLNIKQLFGFLQKHNIKVVHTLHCSFSYTGKCGYHLECDKWMTCCGRCPRLKKYISTLWFDHTKKMFLDKKKMFLSFNGIDIVAPSEWLAFYAKQSFLKSLPISVIHNGIDGNVFFPRNAISLRTKYNISSDEKIIISVAPDLMNERKGGRWVIELAKRFEKVRVFMIGVKDGSLHHPENVILLSSISDQEKLAEYYSLGDLFVICSLRETFSLTCAESLCCGTPVVGFKCGAPETIFKEPYAYFVEYGDLDALEMVVRKQLNSKNNSLDVSNYGKLFSNETMSKKYLELYQHKCEQS